MQMRLAIFASGAGSNAQKIISYFKNSEIVNVSLIVCNNPAAGVLQIAQNEHIEVLLIDKQQFLRGDAYIGYLKNKQIDYIILAGFLWKIPTALIDAYPNKIINIHPALLPKYGGKGMYGHFVHEAIIHAKEKESGITIHYVDEQYDHGDVIFQAKCNVVPHDTADTLAERVHQLEHQYFPMVIEKVVLGLPVAP